LRIYISKPRSIETFLAALQAVKTQKKKAANLLFEEKFVVEQIERLKEMNDNYETLLDYEKVLTSVSENMRKMRGG
jgi:hypothetical protein